MSDGNPHGGDAACPDCKLITFGNGETLMLWCATCVSIHQHIDDELYHILLHAQPGQPGNLGLPSLISPLSDSDVGNNGERPSNQTHEQEHALLDDVWEYVDRYLEMAQLEHISERRWETTTNMQLGHNIFGTAEHHAAELSGFGYPQAEFQPVAASASSHHLDVFHNLSPNPPYVLAGALSQPSASGTEGSSAPHGMGRKGKESARRYAQGLCIWCKKPNPYLEKMGCPPCRERRREYMAEYRAKQRRQREDEMAAMARTAQVEENMESVEMDQEENV